MNGWMMNGWMGVSFSCSCSTSSSTPHVSFGGYTNYFCCLVDGGVTIVSLIEAGVVCG
jgi:hypothetical protein